MIYVYIYDIYFHQFLSNVNVKGQHSPIYGDSWPWVLGPPRFWVAKGPVFFILGYNIKSKYLQEELEGKSNFVQ